MIIYHRTSILESTAKTAVNTINCVGVMGKGLAHAYKKRYPKMFKVYKEYCNDGLFEPGKLWLWKASDQWILNFPTKKHWRNSSKIEWLEAGLQKFSSTYEERGITQISFPKLGCGNGNLEWDVVKPLMEKYLNPLPIEIWIHDYQVNVGMPEHLEEFTAYQAKTPLPKSKDELWKNLKFIEESVGEKLFNFSSKQNFSINTATDAVVFRNNGNETKIDFEEILSNYRIMLSGLLTKKKIGISDNTEASELISLLSLLPHAEPVEIGFPSKEENETAAQIRFLAGYESVAETRKQFELWR